MKMQVKMLERHDHEGLTADKETADKEMSGSVVKDKS